MPPCSARTTPIIPMAGRGGISSGSTMSSISGSGQARSFADLARAVYAALGTAAELRYIEMPEGLRSNYQYFTEAKLDRLRKAGYVEPMTALEDGVGRYVRDYLTQADIYR